MWTVVGYSESVDQAASYNAMNALPDSHVTVVGTRIYIPTLSYLFGYAINNEGTAYCGAYFDSPSLRRVALLDAATVASSITSVGKPEANIFPLSPVKLSPNEGIECYICDNPAAAAEQSALIFLSDGLIAPVSGEIFTVQATAAITRVANAWANGAITFRQTLPVGRYQVVGARCWGTNLNYFRFVPVGYAYRPGGIACNTAAMQEPEIQRYGGLGVWFEFDSITPPTLDIYGNAACTAQTLQMDLIKIA